MKKNIKFTNRFSFKLILYFSFLLILFSFFVGGVFSYMFVKNTTNMYKNNLETRALRISRILSDGPGRGSSNDQNDDIDKEMEEIEKIIEEEMEKRNINKEEMFKDRKRNMRFIEDLGMAAVWYVDANTGEVYQGSNNNDTTISYLKLPPNAEKVIKSALDGKTNTTENFNEFLNERSITVATPIFSETDKSKIEGVVLLHSPITDLNPALKNGIYAIIFSIVIALILVSIISVFVFFNFTKPLNKIIDTTLTLAEGDYSVKTDVIRKDEIGILANATDQLSATLLKSSEESARFEKMRNDFITNISHELRTPITVIRGSAEALCDGVITDTDMINEFHEQILSDSVHLQRLVNDLIDLTKLQNPDFSISKQEVDLSTIIKDAVRSMRQLATKKNIDIKLNDNSIKSSEARFYGDYQRIRQMIIIIVHNAIKFSPENESVFVNFYSNNNEYILDIINKGKGISPENLDKIFERFHKSNDTKNKEGMGLGLAIAKQIALRHNIDIVVTSIPDMETKFKFLFPFKNV